jgi:hypothetical protein
MSITRGSEDFKLYGRSYVCEKNGVISDSVVRHGWLGSGADGTGWRRVRRISWAQRNPGRRAAARRIGATDFAHRADQSADGADQPANWLYAE